MAIGLPQLIQEREEEKSGSPTELISKQGNNLMASFQENTKKLSPVTFVDGQTKDFLKSKLRDNQLLIWRSCVEASIYCAIFHEIKKFLKLKTANHRCLGSVVRYVSNVMLPADGPKSVQEYYLHRHSHSSVLQDVQLLNWTTVYLWLRTSTLSVPLLISSLPSISALWFADATVFLKPL